MTSSFKHNNNTIPVPAWYNHLQQLDNQLRSHGFIYSADRWLNVHDVCLLLLQQCRLPRTMLLVENILAPLICSSSDEQDAFEIIFADWWQSIYVEAEVVTPSVQIDPDVLNDQIIKITPFWPFLIIFLFVAVGLGILFFNNIDTAESHLKENAFPNPPRNPALGISNNNADIKSSTFSRLNKIDFSKMGSLNPMPVREPFQIPMLTSENNSRLIQSQQWIGWLTFGFVIISWFSWRHWRRQVVLNRRKTEVKDPLIELNMIGNQNDLFNNSGLKKCFRDLHQPDYYLSKRLHEKKTVARSMQNGGLYSPVCSERAQVPEILVWVDTQHRSDPVNGIAQTLVTRLVQSGLIVHQFTSFGSAERLFDETKLRWISLEELIVLHARARLILIAESRLLLDDWTGKPYVWVEMLKTWPHCSLLLPAIDEWQTLTYLNNSGLKFAPLSSQGLISVFSRLHDQNFHQHRQYCASNNPMFDPTGLFSQTILRQQFYNLDLWDSPIKPATDYLDIIIKSLTQYLTEKGNLLIAAVAFYPQIHWSLVQAVDSALWQQDSSTEREARLLQIACLPWMRVGWLPNWLRQTLIGNLSIDQRLQISNIYARIFSSLSSHAICCNTSRNASRNTSRNKNTDSVSIELQLSHSNNSYKFRKWLDNFITATPKNSVMQDQIFASLHMGFTRRTLAFLLPAVATKYLLNKVLNIMPNKGLRGDWLDTTVMIGIAVVLGLSVQAMWIWQGDKPILKYQQHQFADYLITIQSSPENFALAKGLVTQLTAQGFKSITPSQFAVAPVDPADNAAIPSSLIPSVKIIASEQDIEVMTFIQHRISYLNYNQSVPSMLTDGQPDTKTIKLVLDKQPLSQASVPGYFRDKFNASFNFPQALTINDSIVENERNCGLKTMHGPQMTAISPGWYFMGSPQFGFKKGKNYEWPQHLVNIRQAFAIMRCEVSVAEFRLFVNETAYKTEAELLNKGCTGLNIKKEKFESNPLRNWRNPGFPQTDNHPVVCVSWHDAKAYSNWLSQKTGFNYRLPTESEWEYAARANKVNETRTLLCTFAIGELCKKGSKTYSNQTAPINVWKPNPWGLFYMHGNAWEWTEDCWHSSYQGAPNNESAWKNENNGNCDNRVIRGASLHSIGVIRSAIRDKSSTQKTASSQGFRLVRTL